MVEWRYLLRLDALMISSWQRIKRWMKLSSSWTGLNRDANIIIEYRILRLDFLDLTIVNEDGQLRKSVYHKSAAELYILPFTSNHPRHIHRNLSHAALLRATRLCSNGEDFDAEYVRMNMSLLLNDYPPAFISRHKRSFLSSEQGNACKECTGQRRILLTTSCYIASIHTSRETHPWNQE